MLWRENERLRVEVENNVVREAFGKIVSLRECWVGERRVARRFGTERQGEGVKWMWERRREERAEGEESFGLERFRKEKEDVVVKSEIGF